MYVKNIYFTDLKLFDEGVLKKERCPQNIFYGLNISCWGKSENKYLYNLKFGSKTIMIVVIINRVSINNEFSFSYQHSNFALKGTISVL